MDNHATIQKVTAVFDDWALAGRAEGMERGHGPYARRAFDLLDLPDGPVRYLDVGCGNGYTVRWAAEQHRGGLALGLDGSAEMVARARALSGHTSARFVHAPFPEHNQPELLVPGSFDAIFSMEVFYYLPDLPAGLREVARLLRSGGRFACVVDFYAENTASHRWPDDLGVPMTLLSMADWRNAMEAADLRVVHQEQLRAAPGSDGGSWKETVGSLMTIAECV
jgi:SAM-dependent methyltransferase